MTITYKTNGSVTTKSLTEWFFGKSFVKSLTESARRLIFLLAVKEALLVHKLEASELTGAVILGIAQGVVCIRLLCNCGKARAFRGIELAYLLAEVRFGRSFNTVAALIEVQCVEICFNYRLL